LKLDGIIFGDAARQWEWRKLAHISKNLPPKSTFLPCRENTFPSAPRTKRKINRLIPTIGGKTFRHTFIGNHWSGSHSKISCFCLEMSNQRTGEVHVAVRVTRLFFCEKSHQMLWKTALNVVKSHFDNTLALSHCTKYYWSTKCKLIITM
jgi:hypothetical protein